MRKPAETSFSRAADARASLSDVVMSYQILLGRDPENSTVMAAGTTQTIAAVMRGLFQSAEFSMCVAQPLAEEALPHHDVFSDRPTPEQIAWLLDKIDTTPKTKAHLRAAADWSSFMSLCLVLLPSAIAKSNNARAENSTKCVDGAVPMKNASKRTTPAALSRSGAGARSKEPNAAVSQHDGFAIQFW